MSPKKNVINARWFKEQIRAAKTTQRQIAIKWGIDPTLISKTLNGVKRISLEEAVKWAEILSQPLSVVAANAGIEVGEELLMFEEASKGAGKLLNSVPVIGWVDSAFTVVLGIAKGPPSVPNPSMALASSNDLVALRCQSGGFMDGALFYYHQQVDPASFYESLERNCVVKISGRQSTVVRMIKRGYEPGRFNLHSFNGDLIEEAVIVEWASPIVWMKL